MTISQTEWAELEKLTPQALSNRMFAIIQDVSYDMQRLDEDDPRVLGAIPRLINLVQTRPELKMYKEIVSSLARYTGLWNYIDKKNSDSRDELVAEAVTVEGLDEITLHREQIAALNTLLSGRNLILSAPTSFGKSILIDAMIASGNYKRIVIILPTIALLDEFRRRLTRRFISNYEIVIYQSQAASRERVIFLGTQERILNREDIGWVDLTVVDEFYKLDPERQDERSLTLNAAVYKLLRRSRQFFFLGPNIEGVQVASDSRWKFDFYRTKFSTVAVDLFDLRKVEDKEGRLIEEAFNQANWPCLIFVSSPNRANKIALQLAHSTKADGLSAFGKWIDENFGVGWDLSTYVRSGVAVHHGRIPRSLASRFVTLFNAGKLPALVCTSTLIEGVNTAAKSIMIYDKNINRKPYDFFTFSNIRGRAGRLGQHHIGSVFLFHSPPQQIDTEVVSPVFGDFDDAPDELVVHLDREDSSKEVRQKLSRISQDLGLNNEQLRVASSIGLHDAARMRSAVQSAFNDSQGIWWSGYPEYDDILAVCIVICDIRPPSYFGVRSAKQLAFRISRLRGSSTMREFFNEYSSSFKGESVNQDEIFKFLRACEYGLPQLLSVMEIFAKKFSDADYSVLVAGISHWFRPEALKNLDEQGVPIQISERFYNNDNLDTLTAKLIGLARERSRWLTQFEREWILDALDR